MVPPAPPTWQDCSGPVVLFGACWSAPFPVIIWRLLPGTCGGCERGHTDALRLLDLALTSWTSVWVESQELQQKATFYLVGKQAEQRVVLLRAWS